MGGGMEYKTIKEFCEAVKSGKIDESKLVIVLDNDVTSFYNGLTDERFIVNEAHGYRSPIS